MKKILFIAVVAAISFASCKKDRVCTCTKTSTDPSSKSGTTIVTYTKAKKSDAKKACVNKTQTDGKYTETTTCSLK